MHVVGLDCEAHHPCACIWGVDLEAQTMHESMRRLDLKLQHDGEGIFPFDDSVSKPKKFVAYDYPSTCAFNGSSHLLQTILGNIHYKHLFVNSMQNVAFFMKSLMPFMMKITKEVI